MKLSLLSELEVVKVDANEFGRSWFLSWATDGAEGGALGGGGGAEPGALGAGGGRAVGAPEGGGGRLDVSGSERYALLVSAPVSMPALPVFLSFGIPPAKRPASCGGPALPTPPPPVASGAPSLLLLPLPGVEGPNSQAMVEVETLQVLAAQLRLVLKARLLLFPMLALIDRLLPPLFEVSCLVLCC